MTLPTGPLNRSIRFAILLLLFAPSALAWSPPPNGFPGSDNRIKSPDGRYVLRNVDYPAGKDTVENWHSIFLLDRKTDREKLFYKYERWVDILWRPSSDALILNDHWASNESRVVLFLLSPCFKRIDVGEQLLRSNRPEQEKQSIETADHVYPHAAKWLDRETVLLRITGYNGVDPDGFTLVYLYNVEKSSFTLREYLHKVSDE